MGKIEHELRVLEIDKNKIIKKLNELGAKKVNDIFQKRYVYDFNPVDPNKWIRLRTDGNITTLTIKEIKSNTVDGTIETEIKVSDFETTNKMLEELGYKHKGYQENKRIKYNLNGIEIDLDTWPGIPTYLEVEANTNEEVINTLNLLDINKENITGLNNQDIYKKIYNINLSDYKNLTFNSFSSNKDI